MKLARFDLDDRMFMLISFYAVQFLCAEILLGWQMFCVILECFLYNKWFHNF